MSNKSKAKVVYKRKDFVPKWLQKIIAIGLGSIAGIFTTLVVVGIVDLIG